MGRTDSARTPPPAREPRFWEEARAVGFETVFAMDFEGGDRTGVVEYGIVAVGPGGIGEARTGLCAPSGKIPFRDRETHGLSDHQLASARPFADQWEIFSEFRRKGPFLAHSAAVEDRFLRRQWRTPGEVPDWSARPGTGMAWGPWLDSCGLWRGARPGESAGLRDCVEAAGLAGELEATAAGCCPPGRCRWHAALFDSLASALLFRFVLESHPDWGLRRVFLESGGNASAEQTSFL